MPYISSDGSIGDKRPRGPIGRLYDAFLGLKPQWKAAIVGLLAFAGQRWLNPDPLANGNIPAAARDPDQHWKRLSKDDMFMRSMTMHLGSKTNRKVEAKYERQYIEHGGDKIEIALGRVDFGGPDGHVAETARDWSDLESVRGTRCSTTRSALTGYFCGAQVAGNQDFALGQSRKGSYRGVKSFSDFVSCRHEKGEREGSHRRSVYRIGIGCEDPLAGYSHAFSIVAQPDGSYFWLQSFIGHYSLQKWMGKVDADGTPHGHLSSLAELQAKLKQVDRLMNISSWDYQANLDYLELFGVDKEKEAMDRHKPPVRMTWQHTHRLAAFYWDEACEYPLPPQQPPAGQPGDDDEEEDGAGAGDSDDSYFDECSVALFQNLLEELKGLSKQ